MKYLYVKFFRDLKKLWPQFFSVFAMAMISMTIFAGMSAVWTGMAQSADEYFDETNLADYWVYAGGISDENMESVRELTYVSEAESSMTFSADCTIGSNSSDIQLTTFDNNTKSVMNPEIRSGETLDESAKGIWIDEDYANEHSIEAGDIIPISVGNARFLATVNGTVLHSEYIYFITASTDSVPNHAMHGYGYISEDYVKAQLGGIVYNQVRIAIDDTDSVSADEIKNDMESIFGNRLYSVMERSDNINIWQVVNEQEQIQKMAILFSAVFVLLALLTMYTTMSRLANNQIVQIGTMKALGFYNSQIYLHYALYGFAVALLGGICGIVLGMNFVSQLVLNVKKSTLTMPNWKTSLSGSTILLLLVIILICTFASVLTARKVIKVVPAQTICGSIEQKQTSAKKMKRSRLSYDWIWSMRAIKTHPARYAMGVIAVAGSMVLMVAGVGIQDSLNFSYDDVFTNQYTYKYAATVKNSAYETVKAEFDRAEVQYSQTISTTFVKDEAEKSGVITVISEGNGINLFDSTTGEEISLPDSGAAVTAKLSRQLDISVGDTISYRTNGSSEIKNISVKAIVNAKLPQGIFVSEEAWNEDFIPDTVYLSDDKGYEIAQESSCISGIVSIENQRASMDTMLESIQSIVYILILAAFVLSAVILYNLGTLNFIERYREYATMKVLGFYKKELRGMVLKDSMFTLVLGYIIGVPASFGFLSIYVEIVSMESMEWVPYISPLHFAIISLFVILFSIIINLSVCRKINKVDMVEALKSTD